MTHTLILTNTTLPDKEFKKQIDLLGFDIVHSPALSVSYCDVNIDTPFVADTLIITSKHAVYNIGNYDIPKDINILCVGNSLKLLLVQLGFTNINHCFENGDALVCHIQDNSSNYMSIVYLRGGDVQHNIKSVCLSLNILFEEYIVYKSEAIVRFMDNKTDILNSNQDVTICVFSKKGSLSLADNIDLSNLESLVRRTNLLCLSQSMLSSLEQFKWKNVLCCTSPTGADILKQLGIIKRM